MKAYIEKSISFDEYLKLIDELLLEGKTTGAAQSEAMYLYGKLNRQRMKRLLQTVQINESLKQKAGSVGRKLIWLIITEGWCGDAAQNIPIIEKIAAESPNIETRYLLRDENLELMDRFLTGGARAIPKLICLEAETLREIGIWGARPQNAQNYFQVLKQQGLEKTLLMENMQRWYLADKNQSLQAEFEILLDEWANKKSAAIV